MKLALALAPALALALAMATAPARAGSGVSLVAVPGPEWSSVKTDSTGRESVMRDGNGARGASRTVATFPIPERKRQSYLTGRLRGTPGTVVQIRAAGTVSAPIRLDSVWQSFGLTLPTHPVERGSLTTTDSSTPARSVLVQEPGHDTSTS